MNRFFTQSIFIGLAMHLLFLTGSYAQYDSLKSAHYAGLSLKDLLNVKIVSASKNQELLFDAPLSASVITRDDIHRAGCNSIMEALRLVPGVIVRQQTNGNYDIHLRGSDNIPMNASFDIASTTTLVMIDSRPIYSYMRGGTFWETLPVDLNDVERIEIVRGPAAALFGPNAVNGVINIITRQTKKDGFFMVANSQQGSYKTFIGNASIGYQGNKWSIIASGNYQYRDRCQTAYFEFTRDQYVESPAYFLSFTYDTVRNVSQRYPDPALAMKKHGANIFFQYNPYNKIKFNIAAGTQNSLVQKVSAENEVTPLSTAASDSRYIDFRGNIYGLTTSISYLGGIQNIDHDPGNKYDFHAYDVNAEYNISKGNLSVKPGISYKSAVYDDRPYSDTANKAGIFNNRGEVTTVSGTLRGEYRMLNNKLRMVAGFGVNKFNYPDRVYTSYQLAATFKINRKNLVRAVYSMAPRSSNIFDTYVDQTIAFFPSGSNKYTWMKLGGNKNLTLLTAKLFEIGYRAQLSSTLNIDVEMFGIQTRNTSLQVTSVASFQQRGQDTIMVVPIVATNLPLKVDQQGFTISANYSTRKFQLKPFVTLQRTILTNYSAYNNMPGTIPGGDIYSGMGTKTTHKSTPTAFGGMSVNYLASSTINVNLGSYFYSSQRYHHLSNTLFMDGTRGIDQIKGKFIINASVSYEPMPDLHFLLNAKNILNKKSREFFKSDVIPFMLLGGITYEF